jgi:hypothetical protein
MNLTPEVKELLVSALEKNKSTSFELDKETISDNDSPTELEYLHVYNISKNAAGDYVIFLRETQGTYSMETPSDLFLSEAGIQTKDQMFLRKMTVKPGIHKLVISKDFSIIMYLIDPITLLRNEIAPDKAINCNYVLLTHLKLPGDLELKLQPIFFFNAIQKLYDDKTIGMVTEGYFQTSSGANFTNKTKFKDTDLRDDPFQMGGQKAEFGKLNFSKLRISWDNSNVPRIFLNGSSDMFANPNKSLPFFRATFCPSDSKHASFIGPIFEHADW